MKLRFKYLILVLVFMLMPVCNVRAYPGGPDGVIVNTDLKKTASENSDIYFIREKINFETCSEPTFGGTDGKYLKQGKHGKNNVIYINHEGVEKIAKTNNFSATISLSCDNAAATIAEKIDGGVKHRTQGDTYYTVNMTFAVSASIPDELDDYLFKHKNIVLIILNDGSSKEMSYSNTSEYPEGLSFVSKFAKNDSGNLTEIIAFDNNDFGIVVNTKNGKVKFGAGISTITSVTISGANGKKIAFLFRDLDQPDSSLSIKTKKNGTDQLLRDPRNNTVYKYGSYDFDGGAMHAESLLVRQGHFDEIDNNTVYFRNSGVLGAGPLYGSILDMVIKPIGASSISDVLIFADKGSFHFNWCGSNAQTSIGFLYFDEIEDNPSQYIQHICSPGSFTGKCGPNVFNDMETYSSGGRVITHNSCTQKTITLNNVYTKTDYDVYRVGNMLNATRCVKVNVAVKFVLTENIAFTLYQHFGDGKLDKDNKRAIYAGGGFGWNNNRVAYLINEVGFKYHLYKDSTNSGIFVFNLSSAAGEGYCIKNAGGGCNSLIWGDGIYGETEVFSDSSCSSSSRIDLNERVKNSINSYVSKGYLLSNGTPNSDSVFQSVDPNDASPGSYKKIIVTDSKSSNGMSYEESVFASKSFIDPKTAKIFSQNDFKDWYIDGGNKWYVPLKYLGSSVAVTGKNFNVSRIRSDLNISASCSIPVKNILYEDDGNGGLKVSYRYRPIKLEDVFNGKNKKAIMDSAQNWAEWYCGNNSNCNVDNSNRNRIKSTYSNGDDKSPLYRIILDESNIDDIRGVSDNDPYISFKNMQSNGVSRFVLSYFPNNSVRKAVFDTHYCGLGVFSPKCNQGW